MTLTLEELWVKAAVEHRLVHVSYKNPETKLVYNKRDIRPEIVTADDGGQTTVWGLLNHNPFVGLKAFSPKFFENARLTNETFKPAPGSRWQELVPIYNELGLKDKSA